MRVRHAGLGYPRGCARGSDAVCDGDQFGDLVHEDDGHGDGDDGEQADERSSSPSIAKRLCLSPQQMNVGRLRSLPCHEETSRDRAGEDAPGQWEPGARTARLERWARRGASVSEPLRELGQEIGKLERELQILKPVLAPGLLERVRVE